ncbi:hypothetical protein BC629DRAFT_893894 [Irpex lacteus]|nr:hypothetical protein BC629DRAFT_893894 [Irpex lacteus]
MTMSHPLSLSRFVFVFAALTAVLVQVSALIRQNALDAQLLNGEFQRMNESDPCNSGQTACIANVPAQCKFGSWQLGQCPSTETSCFALPRPNAQGTFLACLTEPSAASFFHQAGVPGGPVINNTSADVPSIVLPTTSPAPAPTPSTSPAPASSITPQSVVTVTVTLPPSSPSSPSASTSTSTSRVVTTIGAAEALGVLQSALANGAVVVSSSSSSPSASSPSSSSPSSTPAPSHSHSHTCTMSEPTSLSLSSSSRYEPKRSPHHGVRSRRLRLGVSYNHL